MAYNYREEMKKDIQNYLDENGITVTEDNCDQVFEDLLFADSVTGKGSGSYTNRTDAKKNLEGNANLVREMCESFNCADDVLEWFLYEYYESIDVLVRCYLLDEVFQTFMNN